MKNVIGYRKKLLSAPSKGRSLGESVKLFSLPIKKAISIIYDHLPEDLKCPNILRTKSVLGGLSEKHNIRLSWFLINCYVSYGYTIKPNCPHSLQDATKWFFKKNYEAFKECETILDTLPVTEINAALSKINLDSNFLDLYPYIIEPHGHVTRGDLKLNDHADKLRQKKRKDGVYFTPTDVAKFMVEVLSQNLSGNEKWLDPACGTGVFLREILHINGNRSQSSLLDFCKNNIFGFDISALCTESCAFVLFIESTIDCEKTFSSPFDEWNELQTNLFVCDSLKINTLLNTRATNSLQSIFNVSKSNGHHHLNTYQKQAYESLQLLISNKFDRVVMNPPYATNLLTNELLNWFSYRNLSKGAKVNIALAFVELMTDLTVENGVSAGVLPLSIGTSTLKQFQNCRDHLMKSEGVFDFLFFDREPHSLFGEDIKTRNTIIFHFKQTGKKILRTSNLLKWTSNNRNLAFSLDRLVTIPKFNIVDYIPKLSSNVEYDLFTRLEQYQSETNPHYIEFHTKSVQLSSVLDDPASTTFYCSTTAYNFLNCFVTLPKTNLPRQPYSSSAVVSLKFETFKDSMIGFSLLSSRIAFWLWRVKSDGFHVTQRFIKSLPLWYLPYSEKQLEILYNNGCQIWNNCSQKPIASVNGGKLTYSYHTPFSSELHLANELEIIKTLKGDCKTITATLDNFFNDTVLIDGKNRRLKH